MESQLVFKRYEIKYLVSDEQRTRIERAMEPYMVADEHGESTICNIYYDTPSHLLVRRSAEKPLYKEKVRVRSYGRCHAGGKIFVELKKKFDGVVYKRRTLASEDGARRMLAGAAQPADQVEREIAYAVERYGKLVPSCYIAYDRCAYFARDDRSFRVTFDRNIRFRTERLSLSADTDGEQLLEKGFSLMEVKCAGAIPLWLVHELSAMRLYKTSFSKYGIAWERSGAVAETEPAPALGRAAVPALAPIVRPAPTHPRRRTAFVHMA